MKNFNIFGVHFADLRGLGMGGLTRKKGVVFWKGCSDTPMHTMD